jgi:hypothetical protein
LEGTFDKCHENLLSSDAKYLQVDGALSVVKTKTRAAASVVSGRETLSCDHNNNNPGKTSNAVYSRFKLSNAHTTQTFNYLGQCWLPSVPWDSRKAVGLRRQIRAMISCASCRQNAQCPSRVWTTACGARKRRDTAPEDGGTRCASDKNTQRVNNKCV